MDLFDSETTKLIGALQKIWFRGDNGYVVGLFRVSETRETVAVRGPLGDLSEGLPVALNGKFEEHPRYGRQFAVDTIEIQRPEGRNAVKAYLASGLIKGIGAALADRIVAALGDDALDLIEREPERLRDVPGIGAKKADEIHNAVKSQTSLREVMLFLHGHGLPSSLAHKVVEAYGEEAPRLLRNNPYRLADDLVGVGFKRADEVADKLGVARDSEERRQAGLLFALSQSVGREGHCCVPSSRLLEIGAELLGHAPQDLAPALGSIAESRRVIIEPRPTHDADEPHVYPLTLHVSETGLTAAIHRLATAKVRKLVPDRAAAIQEYERAAEFTMQELQRRAVATALRRPFCVITGGPGVGKTTIVRAVTSIVEAAGASVALAAPTGRAAKRLAEATGRPASTLHRLLEYQPGRSRCGRNEHNPIEADMVVVDETSMLDLPLAYNLCRAIEPGTRVVFVGDVDQLPSVGPGRVLADLIESSCVRVVRLTQIFRQSEGSRIVTNAHRIRDGEMPLLPRADETRSDFYFVETADPAQAVETVERVVAERIPAAFGLDPIRDVQVLCPMYRGPLGVDSINDRLGRRLVPGGPELARGMRRFRLGDKVLQVRNNYDLDLFNGDPGRVTHVDTESKKLRVRFSASEIELSGDELDQIVPAYAITVHRSQGSEYPAVVLALDTSHYTMLNRRLLYTAVTRAKRLLVVVGAARALERAVANDRESLRSTGLMHRLSALRAQVALQRSRETGQNAREEAAPDLPNTEGEGEG